LIKEVTMGRIIRWLILVIILSGIGYAIYYYSRPEPLSVKLTKVDRGTVENTVSNTRAGTISACRRTKLSPSMGGQISLLPVKEGERVKKGDLLIELWNKDLTAELTHTKNEVNATRSRAIAACLQADVAEREASRIKELRKIGALSEEQTDRAVTQSKALRADCEAAKASSQMSESGIKVVEANLERTRLYAPFDGIIAEVTGELNEYLTPSPPGIPTPPAVDLIDDSCFYVTAPIDEVDAPKVKQGLEARITLDAFRGKSFAGVVSRIAPYVMDREKQARTVDVDVRFRDTNVIKEMLAGYSADVEIILDSRANTLRIPTEAILDGKRVFLFDPTSETIAERTIEKGISNWAYTEIISGLNEGDNIVLNVDIAGVEDGAAAEISEEEE
jgi:HlyD family secretion protein